MEILNFVALILLSLVGYSGGVVGKAGKFVEIKPQVVDLFMLLFLWTAAIYTKSIFELNKWLLVLLWIVLAILLGLFRAFFRKKTKESISPLDKPDNLPSGLAQRLWRKWERFGHRMGSFQSRALLSFFFFIIVSPFALAVKWFSDPLRIKRQSQETHWHIRKEEKPDIGQYRRQY
jgi:phosphoglycerol transferase MdoB-like AlkP superfamily enzyme